ncbi:MAG: hypothetical protein EPO28_05080, partial [Saprospiraceae bacterium]
MTQALNLRQKRPQKHLPRKNLQLQPKKHLRLPAERQTPRSNRLNKYNELINFLRGGLANAKPPRFFCLLPSSANSAIGIHFNHARCFFYFYASFLKSKPSMGDFIHFILHTNDYLQDWVVHYGMLVYLFLFLIIFSETGLVVTPFLPGDGLVFTVGVIAGTTGALNIWISILLLSLAAILGNTVNYHIGRFLSVRILEGGKIRWVNQKYIDQTHEFFEKHGQKAVILSRFLPVFRTFVPFVAGISKMNRG